MKMFAVVLCLVARMVIACNISMGLGCFFSAFEKGSTGCFTGPTPALKSVQ